jgi:hypothetical protein
MAMRGWVLAVAGLGVGLAAGIAPASAMCIENRSDRNIAVVRSAPFNEMTEFYQTMVAPRGFACETMPMRQGGITPVSVYVIDDRGRCKVATGCYYENRDDQNIFVGAGTMGCATSFNVSNCKSK